MYFLNFGKLVYK